MQVLKYEWGVEYTHNLTNISYNIFQIPNCEASKSIIYQYTITLGLDIILYLIHLFKVSKNPQTK